MRFLQRLWPFGSRRPVRLSDAAARSDRRWVVRRGQRLEGGYDLAETNDDNARHWAKADGLSADAAASPERRRIMRNRARHEVANNSLARGIVLTLANDTIGTGPRLQLVAGDASPEVRAGLNRIEHDWAQWAAATGLAEKLRTMRMARTQDGEAFALLVTNPALPTRVKLDLRLVEADQVTTPDLYWATPNHIDGIVFDAAGNPSQYHVLKQHPGAAAAMFQADYDRIPASQVVHYFRPERPGQHRGLPELMPALGLFAELRRFTLAVIAAAETAADYAAVIKSTGPAVEQAAVEAMETVELERRMATVLPEGWDLGQIKAEQPSTTYPMFKREILNEIARCLNMPYNIAACNSSGYNYASGRLDHQTYYKSIDVDRHAMATQILERVFAAWLREYLADASGISPSDIDLTHYEHTWFWDGREHVDPGKEASAQAMRLANHTTTLAYEYGRQGRDWEQELRQRSRELAMMRQLGLDVGGEGPKADDQDEEEDEEETEGADATAED